MKHLQQMQLIMALVIAINEAGLARMVCQLNGGCLSLNVYGWKTAPGEEICPENMAYDKTVFFDYEEATEQLATIISDLQNMLTKTEAAA